MKTFKEFLAQSYAHLEEAAATESKPATRKEILARISTALKRTKRKSSLERSAYLSAVRAGRRGRSPDVARRANALGMSSEKRAAKKREKTIQDLRQYYPEKDYTKAQKKHEKLKGAVLHGHHITPIHDSEKLKSSMTDEQWKERVRRDAEQGIYHGHHHKNLMGAVVDTTPEHRARRGIRHQTGGAHELESKTQDLPRSVRDKGLLSAAHRRDLQQRVGPFKSTLLRAKKKENG